MHRRIDRLINAIWNLVMLVEDCANALKSLADTLQLIREDISEQRAGRGAEAAPLQRKGAAQRATDCE